MTNFQEIWCELFKAYNRPLAFIIVSHNRAYVNRGLSSCAQHANKMFPCRKHELPSIGGIFTGHSCRPGHTWVSFSHPVRYSGPRRRRRQSYTTLLSHFRDSRQRGKHTKAPRTRTRTHTHSQSVETGLLPSIAFRQWTDIFPFFVRSSFAIFIVSPWRHAGLPCFLFDYSTRSLLESKSTIENFREDSEIRSSLRIFWNWKDFDVFLNVTLLLVRRFRFVYTIVLILQVCYMYSNF